MAIMTRVLLNVDFQHYVESKDMAHMVMKVERPGIDQEAVLYTQFPSNSIKESVSDNQL